jgi:hypothetical protein
MESGAVTQDEPTYLDSMEDPSAAIPVDLTPAQDVEPDAEETARLKRLVAENERTALHLSLAEFDLQQRLEDAERKNAELEIQLETRTRVAVDSTSAVAPVKFPEPADFVPAADVARLKTDWRRAMKTLQQENNDRRSELVLAKGQLHQTQRQLDQEYAGRHAEAARSASVIANLETELEELRHAATKSDRSQSRRRSIGGSVAVIVTAAGAIALAVAIWTISRRPVTACAAAEAESAITESAAGKVKPVSTPAQASPAETFSLPGVTPAGSSVSDPGLAVGMDRLNGALDAFPSRRPEDILREIHRKAAKTDPSLCAFDWNNGQPSIVYGGGGKLSLSATVDKCAAAIEKYR